MIATRTPADLPGNGARVAVAVAALAVIAALVVWLLAGFEAPDLSRSVTTAEPTASLSRCELEPIGRTILGPTGGPTNEPGRLHRLDVLAATVAVTNPTDAEVIVTVVADFGEAATPGTAIDTLPAKATRVLVIPTPSGPASAGRPVADCTIEARFTP